jgi:hypothetical protein
MSNDNLAEPLKELFSQGIENIVFNNEGQLAVVQNQEITEASEDCFNTKAFDDTSFRKPTLLEKAHLKAAYYWLKVYQPDLDTPL